MMIRSLWCRAIYSDGRHNGFTGITRFGDHYYVSFRNSDSHTAPKSRILVIRSRAEDLETWERVADLGFDGDSRDSKPLPVGDTLHLYFYSQRRVHVSISADGKRWSDPRPITTSFPERPPDGGDGSGLWRAWLFHFRRGPGGYYSIARIGRFKDGFDRVVLMRSQDGLHWDALHEPDAGLMAAVPAYLSPFEADLAFLADGTAVAAIRTNAEGFLASSRPPYNEWRGQATSVFNFGGPALWATPCGVLLSARQVTRAEPPRTMLWGVRDGHLIEPHFVPSGGDCSYAGFADGPNGEILMSYYSSHEWKHETVGEGPANIYLARLRVEASRVLC